MGTNQEESLDIAVHDNTVTSEDSELTFRSAQGDYEDSTVDPYNASGSSGKATSFSSPKTSPASRDGDNTQRDANHQQAWGDHPLPRAATDTSLPSPSVGHIIVNGGRAPLPPCPAPTPTASQNSMLRLDSSENLRSGEAAVTPAVVPPVRAISVGAAPLAAPSSTSAELVDAFISRSRERVSSLTGLQDSECRSYSPAHHVVDSYPPVMLSDVGRGGVVEPGRPCCTSCRSQTFFPPGPGDQQTGIDVNVQLTMTLPAENPAIVEASSSVVFTTFFRERFKLEHGGRAADERRNVVLTAQANSRATASVSTSDQNSTVAGPVSQEEPQPSTSLGRSSDAAPDVSTVQEELDQLPHADEGSLEERVACHLARIGDEINRLYGSRFDQIIKRLPEDQDSLEIFSNVARIFFTRRPTNWGQIISLFYFGYRLAVRRLARGIVGAVVQVVQSLVSYCRNLDIFGWIANQGGWRILEYLSLVRPQDSAGPLRVASSEQASGTEYDDSAIFALARVISSLGINREQVQYTLIGAGVTLIFATVLTALRRR